MHQIAAKRTESQNELTPELTLPARVRAVWGGRSGEAPRGRWEGVDNFSRRVLPRQRRAPFLATSAVKTQRTSTERSLTP